MQAKTSFHIWRNFWSEIEIAMAEVKKEKESFDLCGNHTVFNHLQFGKAVLDIREKSMWEKHRIMGSYHVIFNMDEFVDLETFKNLNFTNPTDTKMCKLKELPHTFSDVIIIYGAEFYKNEIKQFEYPHPFCRTIWCRNFCGQGPSC